MLVYEKYIGYIKTQDQNRCAVYGTCFFISANKAVAAAHTFDNTCEPYTIHISGCDFSFTKDDIEIPENTQCAILTLEQSVFPDYDISLFSYNLNFNITRAEDYIWNTSGYYMESSDLMKMHRLSGTKCSVSSDDYLCCLINPRPKSLSYHGMSGSPVFINDLLVGILQVEEYGYDTVENLYLSSATEFMEHLHKSAIKKDVYHNQQIPRINYSEQFSINELIKRKYSKKSDNSVCSFDELLRENSESHTYVLLGEAGLGKTEELKRLAVECPDDLHPLHCSLRNLTTGIPLSDYVSELKKYIEYSVPFCLILDGYDEIKSYSLREDEFPGLLGRLISEIKVANISRYFIIIGTRTAFYYENKFEGFTQLTLRKLTKEDIDNVLDKYTVNHDSFYNEVDTKSLNSFIENPFYLFHIVDLFKCNNGQLPESNKLMDSIISMLMEKQNKGIFSPEKIREAKAHLRKVSACFMMRAFKSGDNTDSDLLELIESYVNTNQRDLIRKTGIVDADDSGNMTFIHNNYFEYLAAEFFNKKYKNNLDGLLSLIAYDNKKGIFNNFKNMVTYLLLIREIPDLKEWIVKNCPDAIKVIENETLTDDMSLSRLRIIVEEDAQKGYYTTYDREEDLSRYVNNTKSISYLLGVIDSSTDELELLNAIRVLGELKNLHGMEDQIRKSLLRLLVSDRANKHHKRDSLYAICDLNLSTEATTAFILEHFSDCTDTEILRGIDRYIYTNQVYDVFADNLIKQYELSDSSDYLEFRVYDCLKRFQSTESMIRLFDTVASKNKTEISSSKSSYLIDTLIHYNTILSERFEGQTIPENLLSSVLRLSIFLSCDCYLERNIFSGLLNSTNNDEVAIYEYYSKTKEVVLFYYLSKDLNCYADFLISKYEEGAFEGEEKRSFFVYCVRGINKDSNERARCIAAIKNKNDTNADESIRRITCNDDYAEREAQFSKMTAELIFDYPRFKAEVMSLVAKQGNSNPDCNELRVFVWDKYSYHSYEHIVMGLLEWIHQGKEKVLETLSFYETKETEWTILTAYRFISNHKDYSDFLDKEQLHIISVLSVEMLENLEKIHSRSLLQSLIQLAKELNSPLPKETLIKLLLVPPQYFKDKELIGFPEYLTERLKPEEITAQIESYIDKGLKVNDLACRCIYYCYKIHYVSDKILSLARMMVCSDYEIAISHAWRYLLDLEQSDTLVDFVLNNKISKKYLISNVSELSAYATPDLDRLVSGWFDDLRLLENADITEDALSEYRENYDYIDRHHMGDTIEQFRSDVVQSMRHLFPYMFSRNVNGFIDRYLDEMIDKKTYCHYDDRQFTCAAGSIRSIEYLDKLLKIYEMICDGSFIDKHEASMVSNDFYNAIIAIGKEYPAETLSLVKNQVDHNNIRYRRVMNLVYDQTYSIQYMSSDKEYTIPEIEQIVFVG